MEIYIYYMHMLERVTVEDLEEEGVAIVGPELT